MYTLNHPVTSLKQFNHKKRHKKHTKQGLFRGLYDEAGGEARGWTGRSEQQVHFPAYVGRSQDGKMAPQLAHLCMAYQLAAQGAGLRQVLGRFAEKLLLEADLLYAPNGPAFRESYTLGAEPQARGLCVLWNFGRQL